MTATATPHRPGTKLPSQWGTAHGLACGACGEWMTEDYRREAFVCRACPTPEGHRRPGATFETLTRMPLRQGVDVTSQPPALEVVEVGPGKGKVQVAGGPRPWPWLDPMTDRNRAARQRERQEQGSRERDVRALIARLTEQTRDGEHVLAEACSEPGVQRRYLRRFDDGRPEQLVGDLLEGWVWRPGPGGPSLDPEPTATVRVGGRGYGKTYRTTINVEGVRFGSFADEGPTAQAYADAAAATAFASSAFRGFEATFSRPFRASDSALLDDLLGKSTPPPPPGFERVREQVRVAQDLTEQGRAYAHALAHAYRVLRDGRWFEVIPGDVVDEYGLRGSTMTNNGWSWTSTDPDEWTRPARG